MESKPGGEDDGSIRDRLALERTVLANERTLLAYLRTAIMLAATGATILNLYHRQLPLFLSGWVLVGVGVGVAILGTARFRRLARSLR